MQTIDLSYIEKKNNNYLLKISFAENQNGIIYRVTAVLFAHDWDIVEAIAETVDENLVKDVFIIKSMTNEKLDGDSLFTIKHELNQLFYTDLTIENYFISYRKNIQKYKRNESSIVHIFNPSSIDSTVLDIRTYDRPGLLFEISYFLYQKEIDIISFTAKSEGKEIRDSFLLVKSNGEKISDEFCETLRLELLDLLKLKDIAI